MQTSKIIVDMNETIGTRVLLLEVHPLYTYVDGVRGAQDGIKAVCLSEKAGFEKIDVKISGILEVPFFNGTPVQVEFDGLTGKLWQNWGNRGEVKLSVSAKSIRPFESRRRVQTND